MLRETGGDLTRRVLEANVRHNVEALRTRITPYHVLPGVFVSEEHPHYKFNGVRGEVSDAMLAKRSGIGGRAA